MKRWLTLILVVMVALVISACSDQENEDTTDGIQDTAEHADEDSGDSLEENDSEKDEINVDLQDADGSEVAEATLTSVDDGVEVQLTGEGFASASEHAFHIHEKGVCEPEDFKSAGGHYNPMDTNHGKEDPDGPHAGDFDNIEADEDGKVDVTFVTDQISLDEEAENTVFTEDGTSFVIHEGADDYKSQPSGDAGDRMACGVIAEPKE